MGLCCGLGPPVGSAIDAHANAPQQLREPWQHELDDLRAFHEWTYKRLPRAMSITREPEALRRRPPAHHRVIALRPLIWPHVARQTQSRPQCYHSCEATDLQMSVTSSR